jgi:transcription initiation factor TFIID subunit TAF12
MVATANKYIPIEITRITTATAICINSTLVVTNAATADNVTVTAATVTAAAAIINVKNDESLSQQQQQQQMQKIQQHEQQQQDNQYLSLVGEAAVDWVAHKINHLFCSLCS